jgi:hypothetical protein
MLVLTPGIEQLRSSTSTSQSEPCRFYGCQITRYRSRRELCLRGSVARVVRQTEGVAWNLESL